LAVVQDSVSAGAESFNCVHLQVEESSQRRDGFSPIYKKPSFRLQPICSHQFGQSLGRFFWLCLAKADRSDWDLHL